ncbi:MAG: hypothetical protein WCT08_02115 [Patescibacteria group bacterium]|jgi:hypothetical protein
MDQNNPQNQPLNTPKNTIIAWVIFGVIIAALLIVGYFLLKQENINTNNDNIINKTNQNVNINSPINVNSNLNVNSGFNGNANSNVNTSEWKVYVNDNYGINFKYPKDWKISAVDNNDLLRISLLNGDITTEDVRDPWTRLYLNQSYIDIGVQNTKVAGWEFAQDLGQEISHTERQIQFAGISVTQSTSVGYNHGIGSKLFASNSVPQLMSQIVYNEKKFIFLRLYSGGDIRTSALNTFNNIISSFLIK